jgi:membrane-anchored protein YejM (alkaline phosphatase superfamily)
MALSWFHMLWVTRAYFNEGLPAAGFGWASVFHLLVWLTYSFLYLVPAIFCVLLAHRLAKRSSMIVATTAVLATSLIIVFIRIDSTIFDFYRFHFNGFVVNLLLTPGGVESLGGGTDTYLTAAGIMGGHVLVQALFWWLAWQGRALHAWMPLRVVLLLLVLAMVGERVLFGLADVRNDGAVLNAAKVYPYYSRVTFRSLAAKFGVEAIRRTDGVGIEVGETRVRYPIADMTYTNVDNPPNIVIFVAESLRWDRLNDAVMPNVAQLARRGVSFKRHYSSGNGTREGLFGLFYGLYGSYWKNFLYAQQSPLLMDRLQALGYQFDLRTSARFSYPEFDKTIFARIPADSLHEADGALEPWQRDEQNASALIEFLAKRDPAKPFMSFFFMESTHARYSFPDSSVIARPYLADFNYASVSRESLTPKIDQLLNRYTNAAHWIDRQVGRVLDEMTRRGLMDNTIVIVTGDHGEEFMEKGSWGHNSSFVEEQIRTPLVAWFPGTPPQTIEGITSHVDIGTTLLQRLGASGDVANYSSGRNLTDPAPRNYVVSSDWHSIAFIAGDMKYRIPYANRSIEQWQPTGIDDSPLSGEAASLVVGRNRQLILDAMKECSRFAEDRKKGA